MNAEPAELDIDKTRPELEGFGAYYASEIRPWMQERMAQQTQAKRRALRVFSLGLLVWPLLVWYLKTSWGWALFSLITGSITYFVILSIVALRDLHLVQQQAKSFLVDKVCAFFGLEFDPGGGDFNIRDFHIAGLFPKAYDLHKVEDCIRGEYRSVAFELAECRLFKRVTRRGTTSHSELFHGVLFRFEFDRAFQGTTLMTDRQGSRRDRRDLGPVAHRIQINNSDQEACESLFATVTFGSFACTAPNFANGQRRSLPV